MGRAIFPNQRVCEIHRWNPAEEKQRFTSSGDDLAVVNAVRRLNGKKAGGLVLWAVLRMNKDGFQVNMSPETLFRDYGIGKDSYRAGWNTLLENGFIVHQEKNRYFFFEFPEEHSKSVKTQLLKVGKSHFQNTENPTFKSGTFHTETIERHNKNNNNTLQGQDRESPLPERIPDNGRMIEDGNQSFVKNETAFILAKEFEERGFKYTGKGKGQFPGYLAKVLNTGYTERDIRTAFDRMSDASKESRIQSHVGYLDTILAEMYENGKCEHGYFLGAR